MIRASGDHRAAARLVARTIVSRCALLLAGLCLAALPGCSKHKPCSVSGSVKFQGQPIPKGAIRFVADQKTPGPGGLGKIAEGQYRVETRGMLSGKYLVMISAFKETGQKLTIDGVEVQEELQYLPAQYNADSTLQLDLQPGGNVKDFDLQP